MEITVLCSSRAYCITKFYRNYRHRKYKLMTEIYIRLGDYSRSPNISAFVSSSGISKLSRLKSSVPALSPRCIFSSFLEFEIIGGCTKLYSWLSCLLPLLGDCWCNSTRCLGVRKLRDQ